MRLAREADIHGSPRPPRGPAWVLAAPGVGCCFDAHSTNTKDIPRAASPDEVSAAASIVGNMQSAHVCVGAALIVRCVDAASQRGGYQ